jgi:hypothetical protein
VERRCGFSFGRYDGDDYLIPEWLLLDVPDSKNDYFFVVKRKRNPVAMSFKCAENSWVIEL